jgi:hypothetical protein
MSVLSPVAPSPTPRTPSSLAKSAAWRPPGVRTERIAERAQPKPIFVSVTAKQAANMARSIPVLVRQVRRELANQTSGNVSVRVDLSDLPPAPICAPLLTLLRLLTRLPNSSSVLVVGVGPALLPCLTAGLPAGVTVVDQAGRRWT